MKQIIIKKFYEVNSIINKKRYYLRDFYKGPLLGTLSHEPKFKQDVKHEANTTERM